jgi:hypothetical protein
VVSNEIPSIGFGSDFGFRNNFEFAANLGGVWILQEVAQNSF